MRRFLLFVGMLAFGSELDIFPAHAASPSFTVSAMNTTMPSSGNGSIPVTLSSVDGYAGSIVLQCPNVNAGAGARVPTCGGGPLRAYNLAANQMIQTSRPASSLVRCSLEWVFGDDDGGFGGLRQRFLAVWPVLAG